METIPGGGAGYFRIWTKEAFFTGRRRVITVS